VDLLIYQLNPGDLELAVARLAFLERVRHELVLERVRHELGDDGGVKPARLPDGDALADLDDMAARVVMSWKYEKINNESLPVPLLAPEIRNEVSFWRTNSNKTKNSPGELGNRNVFPRVEYGTRPVQFFGLNLHPERNSRLEFIAH